MEADERVRALEQKWKETNNTQDRANYIRALRRAGDADEADVMTGYALLEDSLEGIRWNRPSNLLLMRLARHYTLPQIREMLASNTPNRLNIMAVTDAVYHRHYTMADGSPRRYRVTGKLRTLKSDARLGEFTLPVMYGGFNRYSHSVHLTQNNADEFMLDLDGD